jgi:hypothetical protein
MRTSMRVLLTIVAASMCLAIPGIANASTDIGFANSNYIPSSNVGYGSYYDSTDFEDTMSDLGVKYQRFFVYYEIAGTGNSAQSGCTTPDPISSASDLADLYTALGDAENAGYIPVLAIRQDTDGLDAPSGENGYEWSDASTPGYPSDIDEFCGVAELEADLHAEGLLPSTTRIEAMNEPNDSIGTSCNSAAAGAADCAARYYADAVQATTDEGYISANNIIAGTFQNATSDSTTIGTTCSNGGFDSDYMCYLDAGDSAGDIPGGTALDYYNRYATSWSFHDYDDLANDNSCTPSTPSDCTTTDAQDFYYLLDAWAEPTSNVWITEAGASHSYLLTPTEQANEAYGWTQLENVESGYPAHLFWYQWATNNHPYSHDPTDLPGNLNGDPFDSALVDGVSSSTPDGTARESACVLLLGYADRADCTG